MFPPLLRLQSDERLARLSAAGAGGAFDVLAERYRPALVRACTRILPEAQAEDAAQQALINAHQALRRNGPPQRFEPWLHRIAVNAALKELHRFPEVLPLDEERINGVEQPPERQERRERLREVVDAVAALPSRQRRALLLRELEGRSHVEIARSLGLTPGAVRQLIHRARSGVRSAISALTPYGVLLRLTADNGENPSRLAELVGGGVAGGAAAKTVAAALVAGGVAGGVAVMPEERETTARAAGDRAAPAVRSAGAEGTTGASAWIRDVSDHSRSGPNRGSEGDDRSGPGSGDAGDRSGPSGSISSGSGGGDVGSSGSGLSGSGSSGSGSSGSGTSGSETSGSGFSGSGSSGSEFSSGSSGSGSLDVDSSGSGGGGELD